MSDLYIQRFFLCTQIHTNLHAFLLFYHSILKTYLLISVVLSHKMKEKLKHHSNIQVVTKKSEERGRKRNAHKYFV